MSCPSTIPTAIDDAVEALQALQALLTAGTPTFWGWHVNPIDESTTWWRTNQVTLTAGTGTAITFHVDPANADAVRSVRVEFAPY